jgi:hypothetical protein
MAPDRVARLYQMSKEEWRDIARMLRPDWTDQQFDEEWLIFQYAKWRKTLQ